MYSCLNDSRLTTGSHLGRQRRRSTWYTRHTASTLRESVWFEPYERRFYETDTIVQTNHVRVDGLEPVRHALPQQFASARGLVCPCSLPDVVTGSAATCTPYHTLRWEPFFSGR